MNKNKTDLILINLNHDQNHINTSILTQIYAQINQQIPNLNNTKNLKTFFTMIQDLNTNNHLLTYHNHSNNNLLTTILEMTFTNHCNLALNLDTLTNDTSELPTILFNEELGTIPKLHNYA